MKKVVIESPYAGDTERNLAYVRAAMKDCLDRGEAPIASHAIYTQKGVLSDDVAADRNKGIQAGFVWGMEADLIVIYTDLGMSKGMQNAVDYYLKMGKPIEYRSLDAYAKERNEVED